MTRYTSFAVSTVVYHENHSSSKFDLASFSCLSRIPFNQNTDLDRCCTNLTITSNGWSKYVHGHQIWGDYTKSFYAMNNERHEYKHNNPSNDKYLYWDGKNWVVS